MTDEMVWSRGIVVRGHRVASGLAGDSRFPAGTIRPQLGFFRGIIPDFDAHLGGTPPFAGTINVALEGGSVVLGEPDFRTGPLRWTEHFPPENFLISRCELEHGGVRYPAYLYVPDPATKPGHHQALNVVELLAGFVPGLAYGDPVAIGHAPGAFTIVAPPADQT